MKRLVTALLASLLFASSAGWAGGGHGHGHGHGKHWNKHAEKEWKHERKAWKKEQKHWAKHGRHFDNREVVHYYQPAPRVVEHHHYSYNAPVYAPPATFVSAPGVYIQLSNY